MVRDFVEVTIGFEKLGEQLGKSPKSLRQALDPERDTQARDLPEIVVHTNRISTSKVFRFIWRMPLKS
jgi:hypothetical protein